MSAFEEKIAEGVAKNQVFGLPPAVDPDVEGATIMGALIAMNAKLDTIVTNTTV